MNKGQVVLLAGVVITLTVFTYLLSYRECPTPERPEKLPEAAVWFGGCDGGNWLDYMGAKEDGYQFRVFRDWDGELMLDAIFIFEACSYLELNKSNWSKHVSYFMVDSDDRPKIIIRNSDCHLRCI